MSSVWAATLAPPGELVGGANVGGRVTVKPSDVWGKTSASILITGLVPGSTKPWHIHRGLCPKNGEIVGPAGDYIPLTIGQDGQGSVTVDLPFTTPTDGDYSVNVHESPSNLGTIVACGNLAKGM